MATGGEYTIAFSGLKLGKHRFNFQIEREFLEIFDYHEFHSVSVPVVLTLEKKPNLLELKFKAKGTVEVNCDVTDEPYEQPIKGSLDLIVKFGERFDDEADDILILPHGSSQVDVSQYIYELIVLAVPAKRIHPGVVDGTLKSEALQRLEALQPGVQRESTKKTDPRWDGLKSLLTKETMSDDIKS